MTHRSPKIHRDPPDRPEPLIFENGYLVEPEPVDPRVPYHGWASVRDRWDRAGAKPISHGAAVIGLLACVAFIVAFAFLLACRPDATPRSEAVIPFSGRAWTLGETDQPQSGAPQHASLQAVPGDAGYVHGRVGALRLYGAPPSGAASTAIIGFAAWCAPTPTKCQSWGDDARLGAVESFTFGDTPYPVRVRREDNPAIYVDVQVVSHCACGIRNGTQTVIDLSPAAFAQIAPLGDGVVLVAVEPLSPGATLPPTDTPDQSGVDPPPHPDDERMRLEVRD